MSTKKGAEAPFFYLFILTFYTATADNEPLFVTVIL